MGAKNEDRIPIAQWRASHETIAQMQAAGWVVISHCPKCGVKLRVDVDVIAWRMGSGASLWNRITPCRQVGCNGAAVFEAKIPGVGFFQPLKAPIPDTRDGSITLAALARAGGSVRIMCYAPGCQEKRQKLRSSTDFDFTAEAAGHRWGFDLTLKEIQARWRCPICGNQRDRVHVEPYGFDYPGNGPSARP